MVKTIFFNKIYILRAVDFQEQLRKGLINQHIGLIRESVENGAKIKLVEDEKGLSWVYKKITVTIR